MSLKIKKFGDRSAVKQHIGEESLTQQSLMAETDVNNIMRKYEKTGILTHVARYAGEIRGLLRRPRLQRGPGTHHGCERNVRQPPGPSQGSLR